MMRIKKIFFVGLGGAGQRHLRVFKKILPTDVEFLAFRAIGKTPLLNPDFTVCRHLSVAEKYHLELFSSLEEGLGHHPDLIVIANPTAHHFNIAKKAAEQGINIFVEKPFSHNLNGFEAFKSIVIKNKLCFFVSFQKRFHPFLQRIKSIIQSRQLGKIIYANFNMASYMPVWHPYENFRDLYACKQELGGGVLLTESHELDLCYWFFGLPHTVYCAGGQYAGVKLDVEDTVQLIMKYQDFSVNVNLSFMQKHIQRNMFIAGTDGFIECDFIKNKFIFDNYRNNKISEMNNVDVSNDELFEIQAKYFLENFSKISKNYLNAAEASLVIAQAAKQSMSQGREVVIY